MQNNVEMLEWWAPLVALNRGWCRFIRNFHLMYCFSRDSVLPPRMIMGPPSTSSTTFSRRSRERSRKKNTNFKNLLQEGGRPNRVCVCAQLVKVVLCIYTYIYTTVWTDVCINIYAHTWTYEIWYDSILWLCALYAMPGRFGNKGCSSRVCGLNLWLQERIQKLHPRTPIKELVKYSSQQAGSSFYAHFAGNLPVHP